MKTSDLQGKDWADRLFADMEELLAGGGEGSSPLASRCSFAADDAIGSNERIDEILALIPITTDEEELKALYTEAVEIYLTDVPNFSLMYRPQFFHFVNESVWTNFPYDGDGTNIPPTDCTDGYGIAALYNLQLVEG